MGRSGRIRPCGSLDGARRFPERLQGSGRPPEFLSTYPSEPTRIRQIEAWIPEAMQSYRPH